MPRTGRCINYSGCTLAKGQTEQTIPDGADFICNSCHNELADVGQSLNSGNTTSKSGFSGLVKIILALAAILLIVAVISFALLKPSPPTITSTTTSPSTSGSTSPQISGLIKKFDASQLTLGTGDKLTLNWEVSPDAGSVTLTKQVGNEQAPVEDSGLQGATGKIDVTPAGPITIYTLTANGSKGQASEQKKITIHVGYNQGNVLVFYEKTARPWIERAQAEFDKAHESENHHLVMDYRGSREGKQDILYNSIEPGTSKYHLNPVVWNSGDTYWPNKLNVDWKKFGHGTNILDASPTILLTRYVLVMWKDRADCFEKASRTDYKGNTWKLMRVLATKGWAAIGGDKAWGKLKLVHSNPVKSSSGMLTLALILEEYRRQHPHASPSSSEYKKFMLDIENALVECPDTTGKALDAMLNRGKEQIDMAVSYEANAIATVDKGRTDIQIVYPLPTIIVNFPCAVLKHAPWVKPEEAAYGQKFVDYLLTPEVQQRAPEYGFRPAMEVTRAAVEDAFSQPKRLAAGVSFDASAVAYPSDVNEVDDLIYQWSLAFPQYK